MDSIVTMPVSVIVERRAASSPWADHVWRPSAVLLGAADMDIGAMVDQGADRARFHAGTAVLELHRADADALKTNLDEKIPRLWVVLTPAEGTLPWRVQLVTAAPYHTETYLMSDDEAIVDTVTMPGELAALVAKFVEAHWKDKPFVKRRRDRAPDSEAFQFSKDPIFSPANPRHRDAQKGDRDGG